MLQNKIYQNFIKEILKTFLVILFGLSIVAWTVRAVNFLDLIVENGYSRVPVFKDNIDNITGILYVKDLLPHIDEVDFEWNSLLRDAYFVPENKKLDDLLTEFKNKRNHLAIVVDEYGELLGLITLEDIIEEIVGEIVDELDSPISTFGFNNEGKIISDGSINIKDLYKEFNLELKEQ